MLVAIGHWSSLDLLAPAVVEFMLGPLIENPHRVGHALRGELQGLMSARRGPYRVVYEINEDARTMKCYGLIIGATCIGHADRYRLLTGYEGQSSSRRRRLITIHPIWAYTSISTFSSGSSRADTSTSVAAGRMSVKTSRWAAATSGASAISVT